MWRKKRTLIFRVFLFDRKHVMWHTIQIRLHHSNDKSTKTEHHSHTSTSTIDTKTLCSFVMNRNQTTKNMSINKVKFRTFWLCDFSLFEFDLSYIADIEDKNEQDKCAIRHTMMATNQRIRQQNIETQRTTVSTLKSKQIKVAFGKRHSS